MLFNKMEKLKWERQTLKVGEIIRKVAEVR